MSLGTTVLDSLEERDLGRVEPRGLDLEPTIKRDILKFERYLTKTPHGSE